MKKYLILAAVVVLAVSGLVISQNFKRFSVALSGYEEVPALSTPGNGTFTARIDNDGSSISYRLTYGDLETDVTQAHIHLGQTGVNGGISVFLCSNLGNGPDGTQPCPVDGGEVSGTFSSVDVIGPTGQGIAAGEFDELVQAMRAGATYVNVHSVGRPGGEVRSQIEVNDHRLH